MRLLKGLIPFVVLVLTFGVTFADDLEDLETAFEGILEKLNNKDLEGFVAGWHPEAVMFTKNQLFPLDLEDITKPMWARIFEDIFAQTDQVSYTPTDVNYRIVGDVGMVWGLTQVIIEPKQGTRISQDGRLSATLVKSDGKWKILSWHGSLFPERLKP